MAIDWQSSEPAGDRSLEKRKKRRARKKRAAANAVSSESDPKLPPPPLPPVLSPPKHAPDHRQKQPHEPTHDHGEQKQHQVRENHIQPRENHTQPRDAHHLYRGKHEQAERPQSPPQPHPQRHASLMSPRKQAILRHKKSDASVDEPSFVSEVKQLKKNRKPPSKSPAPGADDEKFSQLLAGQSMADKATVFRAPSARISVYHEQVVDPTPAASGTLLGHGEFTIFQLHNGDITYLACGPSFVYPLLPKLKILRVNRTHFILPLVNPQRYWKIDVDTADDAALAQLENVLQGIVNYTTLYVDSENARAGHVDSRSLPNPAPGAAGAPDETTAGHYIPYFNAIPESPPSAPVSPHQLNLYVPQLAYSSSPVRGPRLMSPPQLDLNAAQPLLPSQAVLQPPVPTLAHALPQAGPQTLSQPTPPQLPQLHGSQHAAHANPYKYVSNGSDSSSMDSLLDEYEENVSMTKSILFNASRPPSQSASLVSASRPPNIHYTRGRAFVLPERSVAGSSYGGRKADEPADDGFPATSLSQYNRRRTSQGGRSRQSSVSELYTSVSNWMEPGATAPQLTHSRSNYTLGSRASASRPVNVKDTYRDIYRSITSHDIAGLAAVQEKKADARPYSKLLVTDQFSRKPASAPRPARQPEPSPTRLSSSEVFRLLSQREEKVERPSGIGRFFGW